VSSPHNTASDGRSLSGISYSRAQLDVQYRNVDPFATERPFADFTWPSAVAERIPESSSPNVNNKSHIITAVVDQPVDGVLVATGGVVGGYALFVKEGKPAYK
jgi:hypothetical protein